MSIKSLLIEINNSILDLQNADYNTFERPLKRLAQTLASDELAEINSRLKSNVDFEAFLREAEGDAERRSNLNWPVDKEQELGLTLLFIERAALDPDWFTNFGFRHYYAGSKLVAGIHKMTSSIIIPFGRDYKTYVEKHTRSAPPTAGAPRDFNRVFIVHGHDEAPREMVARFISLMGLEPVILHEQANRGMTIPEKLIAYSNVGFAVVLLTPDDEGRAVTEKEAKPRARQNVVLELGYFVGKLGRESVCALVKGDPEMPSDYVGVVYTKFDDAGAWKQKLAQELQAVGYEIDWNKIMGGR